MASVWILTPCLSTSRKSRKYSKEGREDVVFRATFDFWLPLVLFRIILSFVLMKNLEKNKTKFVWMKVPGVGSDCGLRRRKFSGFFFSYKIKWSLLWCSGNHRPVMVGSSTFSNVLLLLFLMVGLLVYYAMTTLSKTIVNLRIGNKSKMILRREIKSYMRKTNGFIRSE